MIERNYESFDDVIFYNAAEKNKNKAIKYVLLLSLTNGLKGSALKSYLQNLDVTVKGAKANYKNILKARKVCDINYQNYESDFINRVIAYFCADVESSKAAVLLGDRQNNIICIYGDFRKKIYEQQQKLFQEKFEQTPKMPSSREYLKTNVWLYCYSKQVFVSAHALQTKSEAKIHTKKEISQIKLINCLLRRRFEKSSNFSYVEHRIAEHIWRKDKKFSDLVQDLTKLVENALPF